MPCSQFGTFQKSANIPSDIVPFRDDLIAFPQVPYWQEQNQMIPLPVSRRFLANVAKETLLHHCAASRARLSWLPPCAPRVTGMEWKQFLRLVY